jgi:hypothetical protein
MVSPDTLARQRFVASLRDAHKRGRLVVSHSRRARPSSRRAHAIDAAAIAELIIATPSLLADARQGASIAPLLDPHMTSRPRL